MKLETVCLAGQHSQPWGVLVDGVLDCELPRCAYEKAAAFAALLKYPGQTVHTTASPEHYSNQPPKEYCMKFNESELYNAFHLMKELGGHFASHLADAWFFADSGNRARIEAAFPDLIGRYVNMDMRSNSNDAED